MKLEDVLKNIVLGMKEEDFVESVKVGDKWWDIYRFKRTATGKTLLALRLAPEGHVEIGGIGYSVEGITESLQSKQQ